MFGVGLHFSLDDLCGRAIAMPGAVGQIACATLLGMALAWLARLAARRRPGLRPRPVGGQHRRAAARAPGAALVETERGRIAVGWLIVEDLAMVLTLVLLPALARSARRRRRARRRASSRGLALAIAASRSERSRPSCR